MSFKAVFILECVAVLAFLYIIYAAIYRLYFHPLARFPGPKLGIITYWYEFYYDIIRRGQYTFKIRELHEKYGQSIGRFGKGKVSMLMRNTGPVIRINPDDLHFNDPDFLDEIYTGSGGKVEKPYKEANTFGPFPAVCHHPLPFKTVIINLDLLPSPLQHQRMELH